MIFSDDQILIKEHDAGFESISLSSCPSFECLPLEVAIQMVPSSVSKLILSAPVCGKRAKTYVDVQIQHLSKGQLPSSDQWHADTFIHEYSSQEPDINHLYILNGTSRPIFLSEPLDVDSGGLCANPTELFDHVRKTILQSRTLKTWKIPDSSWVTFGPRDLHKVTPADADGIRLLVRVRETNAIRVGNGAIIHAKKKDGTRSSKNDIIASRSRFLAEFDASVTGEPEYTQGKVLRNILCRVISTEAPAHCRKWYADLFFNFASDVSWLSKNIIENAINEYEGARKAVNLAAVIPLGLDVGLKPLLLQHARDEWHHAKMFLALFDFLLPNYHLEHGFRQEMEQTFSLFPDPEGGLEKQNLTSREFLDHMVQINLGELRTRYQVKLFKQIVEVACPQNNIRKACSLVDKLTDDENRHVAYSAMVIEDLIPIVGFDECLEIAAVRHHELNIDSFVESGGDLDGVIF
jgi:hypothetical protein